MSRRCGQVGARKRVLPSILAAATHPVARQELSEGRSDAGEDKFPTPPRSCGLNRDGTTKPDLILRSGCQRNVSLG